MVAITDCKLARISKDVYCRYTLLLCMYGFIVDAMILIASHVMYSIELQDIRIKNDLKEELSSFQKWKSFII